MGRVYSGHKLGPGLQMQGLPGNAADRFNTGDLQEPQPACVRPDFP